MLARSCSINLLTAFEINFDLMHGINRNQRIGTMVRSKKTDLRIPLCARNPVLDKHGRRGNGLGRGSRGGILGARAVSERTESILDSRIG
jgi:hypothetical protein